MIRSDVRPRANGQDYPNEQNRMNRIYRMGLNSGRWATLGGVLVLGLAVFILAGTVGCGSKVGTPDQRFAEAKALFESTAKTYHLPSAEARGPEQQRLLSSAASGYEAVVRQYSDQPFWCAQSLRSLANVRASQGQLDEAIKLYARVGDRYPAEEWEVLQAWKSAGDLLYEANRKSEASTFYQRIIQRFDVASSPAIVKATVRGAKRRLEESNSAASAHF